MENALQKSRPSDAPVRDICVITAEIRDIRRQANAMALIYAVEIGRRLVEAKEALPYGEWGRWLKEEAEFSQSTANNFMRLFEEYGSAQISIFGASVDSQTFANLPYSKALSLLAVPAEEREEFAEEVHADELSVRELNEAIKQRDMLKKALEMKTQQKKDLEEKYHALEQAQIDALNKASEAEGLQGRLEQMTEQVKREQAAAEHLRIELEKAQKNPTIPKATLDKLRKKAEEAAAKEAAAGAAKELEAAKKKAEKATEEAAKAKNEESRLRRELEEAKEKLKTASPEVAAFKALFDDVQGAVAKLRGMINKIRSNDPETAEKLTQALKAFGKSL